VYHTWYSDGMTDQPTPAPHEAVAERIETRRAALLARHAEAPAVAQTAATVCDGWGLVPVLAMDGNGYEPAACLGCALCAETRPALRQADPFARLPVVDADEIW